MDLLRFEILSKREVEALNRIHGYGGRLEFTVSADSLTLSVTPQKSHFEPTVQLLVKLSEYSFILQLDRLPVSASLREKLSGEDLSELPLELQSAIKGALFDGLCQQVESRYGCPADVEITEDPEQFSKDREYFGFNIHQNSVASSAKGVVICSAQDLEWLSQNVESYPTQRSRVSEENLVFKVRFEIGRSRLDMETFRQLQLNDIIFFDGTGAESEIDVAVRIGPSQIMQGKYYNDQITLSKLFQRGTEMTEDRDMTIEADGPDQGGQTMTEDIFDSLPVMVGFDLGKQQLSLSELKMLQPGYVFELEQSPDKPVTITANGKEIGMGQLVQVGDRMGVRILEFGENGQS